MNRLRTGGQARISFFSFQDIITSVTGILILVTLMLSFSLKTGDPETTEEQRLQSQLQNARERLGQVERENQRLQQRQLEAAALPSQTQLQTQIESLRREQSELQQKQQQTQTTLASARERMEKQLAQHQTAEELRKEVTALETQLEDLRQKLARAKMNVNTLFIVPDPEARRNPKTPLALIVSGDRLRAQRLNGAETQDANITSPDALRAVLARHDPQRDFLVFYFRPSGAKWFDAFRSLARDSGFEVGYDAVEEQKQIVFSTQ